MDLKDMWTLDLDRASQALGFSSVVDHIAQKPSIGYGAIAEELGPGIAPIQVVRAYLVGARKQGELRSAIIEHLRRCILEELPSGWGVGHDSSWKATKAISGWISEVVVSGDNATLQSRLLEIGKRIKGNPPPEGWAPVTPHDELLASYFEGFDV